jgi:hypothetical protein
MTLFLADVGVDERIILKWILIVYGTRGMDCI